MIELLRLDERLIHGQVATQWLTTVKVDSVIVCDDNAAGNAMLRGALMLAAPKNMKTVVKTCDDTIRILTDPRCEKRKVFVVAGKLSYIQRIMDACSDIRMFIVGNYGAINKDGTVRKRYADSIYLTDEEKKQMKEMIRGRNYPCWYWTVPAVGHTDLNEVLGQ